MTSEKVAYWLALAAFAFLLSNHFLASHRATLDALSAVSMAGIERVSSQGVRIVALAYPGFGPGSVRTVRYETRVACAEARLASVRTSFARRQAALAQIEVQRALDREP